MSTTSASATSSVAATTSSAVTHTLKAGSNLKVVGIILAVASGVLIGASFVLKKKGLIRSQAGGELGEGVAYLKSALWWSGMIMMILGEICNFAAYAFVEAIVVTPLGALSFLRVAWLRSVYSRLSHYRPKRSERRDDWPDSRIPKAFPRTRIPAFISVLITASLVVVFYFAPKYGKKSMLWYISVCSMIGGISVSVTTGLGAAIVQTALGDNQFKYWFMYFLFVFVIVTLLVEVYYLNVALALFNTAMVTPTYYVIFTFCSMVTTIVLFKGLAASPTQIITIVMGFLVICLGITILQMSKVDPEKLNKLDRRSTLLLQAARAQTETVDEKGLVQYEDPGMDTLRGSFGTVGSIIRARTVRRMSQSSYNNQNLRMRPPGAAAPHIGTPSWLSPEGVKRHQLYDAPVPRDDASSIRAASIHSQIMNKRPTIKFDSQEVVHSYNRPGEGDANPTHEHRPAHGSMLVQDGYPPMPVVPPTPNTAVREGKLLEIDSPDLSRNSGPALVASPNPDVVVTSPTHSSADQTLDLPPLINTEHTVHSAPPTIYARFARTPGAQPIRKDSREIFDPRASTSGATGAPTVRGTLLSFPSVTDSEPSMWDDAGMESVGLTERESRERLAAKQSQDKLMKAKEKERSREREKVRTPKKYPKGLDAEEDEQERESLWRKANGTEEDSSNSSPEILPPEVGSIRLVQPGPRF
ncbi:unnamed protein product [Cyclocybe aegerita]|uniref:DUF803-domain-containing protein n=1 Tax=Cyclocybe aegerita TaxID=1973307 RepID=A0A8S0WFK2_CYCAE|nr:unnamed protein product [Cyclocybe aegerita]